MFMNKILLYVLIVALILMAFVTGSYSGLFIGNTGNDEYIPLCSRNPFKDIGSEAVYIDGKPVIRMYSTTWCPHCGWISPTYDRVAKEYADAGKIIAYHWLLDTGDNTLTEEIESEVPASEIQIFDNFNPRNSIPTFIFGEKYYRIGTGCEKEQDLVSEENEFRQLIELLIGE